MGSQLNELYNQLFQHIGELTDLKSKNKNPQDVYDLIKELQKFQVELEMENEELHNALEKLNNEIEKPDQFQMDLGNDQNLLESIIEGISDAIYVKDLKGRYLLFNSTAEEITGKKSSEVLGKDDTFLFPPDEAKAVMARDFSVMNDGTEQTYEETITTASGEKRTYLSTKGPLIDGDNNIIGLFGIARDITGRKKAEDSVLKAKEQAELDRKRLETILETTPSAVIIIESDGRISYINPRARQIYGIDVSGSDLSTVISKVKSRMVNGSEYPVGEGPSGRALKGETVLNEEMIIEQPDGTTISIMGSTAPILNSEGKITAVVAIFEDITERKKAERALKESEEKYKDIIENIQDGFFRLDINGKIIMASPSLAEMYGFDSPQEMIGITAAPLYKNVEDREQMLGKLNKHGKLDDYEVEAMRGTDSFWASINAQFYYDVHGQIQGIEGFTRDITKRKISEEELKQRSSLLDISYEAIFSWDYNKGILSWNKGAERLYGFNKEEAIGNVSHDLLKTKFPIEFNEFMEKLYNEKMWNGDLVHTTKNGSKIIVESRHQLIQDSSGRKIVIETNRDITGRKKAEKALKESEERYYNLFKDNHAAMLLIEPETGKIADSNHAANSFYGYTQEEMLGMNIGDINLLDNKNVFSQMQKAQSREKGRFIFKHRLANGEIRDVSVYSGPINFGNIKLLYSIIHDITQQKKAEEKLLKNNERFELFSDAASSLLSSENPERIVSYICKNAMQYLDCDVFFNYLFDEEKNLLHLNAYNGIPEETGKSIEWIDLGVAVCGCVGRDGCRIIAKDIQNTPDERTELVKSFGVQAYACHPIISKGKTIGTLSFGTKSRASFNEDQIKVMRTVTDYVATAMERKKTQEQIKKALEKLQESNEELEVSNEELRATTDELKCANDELEAFAYSVSHDLRTPLRAIDGYSKVLLRRYDDKLDENGKRFLHNVRDNTEMMSNLINDILALSRAGRTEIEKSEVDMELLVRNTIKELKPTITGRNIYFKVDSLPNAYCDRIAMHQILTNLFSNSIKFTEPKEAALIEVGAEEKMNEIIYYVKDNGVGFNMKYIRKLFDLFQRLHSQREFEGTGVGLAIVKRLINRQGGHIWAEGEVNQGAIFYFTLPKKILDGGL